MDYKLHYFPEEVLKKRAAKVENLDDHKFLISAMKSALYEYNAQGIAANQLGEPVQILCILYNKESLIMVNPSLEILTTDVVHSTEGCLSFPGVSLNIPRLKSVRADFLTERGEPAALILEGIDAVAFQHELDHLNGVVMVDHVGRLERRAALKRVQKTKKRYSL